MPGYGIMPRDAAMPMPSRGGGGQVDSSTLYAVQDIGRTLQKLEQQLAAILLLLERPSGDPQVDRER